MQTRDNDGLDLIRKELGAVLDFLCPMLHKDSAGMLRSLESVKEYRACIEFVVDYMGDEGIHLPPLITGKIEFLKSAIKVNR